jgi:hypothetical protein
MYQNLPDKVFLRLIFTSEDRLGMDYIKEANVRRSVVIPFMYYVLSKECNYQFKDNRHWGVIHATHILGILRNPKTFNAFVSASKFSNIYGIRWIWEALPECYFRLGKGIIPRLMCHIEALKSSDHDYVNEEIMGLWNFWRVYPEERQRIEIFLINALLDAGTDPLTKTDLIRDFVQIGRKDLKPIFKRCYEKREVDSEVFPWEELEDLYERPRRLPTYRYNLMEFYSAEEIEARQEDARGPFEQSIEEELILENFDDIPEDCSCPCGSGKKFKRCHLPWAEREFALEWEEEELEREQTKMDLAVQIERKLETQVRNFLSQKGQTGLFSDLKSKVLEVVKAPTEEFTSKGLIAYLEPVFSKIEFKDKKETEDFRGVFTEYFNALSHQLPGYPKGEKLFH